MLRAVPSLNPSIRIKFRIRNDGTAKAVSMRSVLAANIPYVSRTHKAAIRRNLLDIIQYILFHCCYFIVALNEHLRPIRRHKRLKYMQAPVARKSASDVWLWLQHQSNDVSMSQLHRLFQSSTSSIFRTSVLQLSVCHFASATCEVGRLARCCKIIMAPAGGTGLTHVVEILFAFRGGFLPLHLLLPQQAGRAGNSRPA